MFARFIKKKSWPLNNETVLKNAIFNVITVSVRLNSFPSVAANRSTRTLQHSKSFCKSALNNYTFLSRRIA